MVDYLKTVKMFLDDNPNEILTFIFTNPDSLSITDIWKPAFDSAGMSAWVDFQSWRTMTLDFVRHHALGLRSPARPNEKFGMAHFESND